MSALKLISVPLLNANPRERACYRKNVHQKTKRFYLKYSKFSLSQIMFMGRLLHRHKQVLQPPGLRFGQLGGRISHLELTINI